MQGQLYTPYGFRDRLFEDAWQRGELARKLHTTFMQFGYRDAETPLVEYLEVFDKERGSIAPQDMYKFVDRDGELLVLRPDMTPALARMASFYFTEKDLPLRITSSGETFRYNSRYSAKQRQLAQTGIELYGKGTVQEDAEVLALAVRCMTVCDVQEFRITIGLADLVQDLMDGFCVRTQEQEDWSREIESKNRFALEQRAGESHFSKEQVRLLTLFTEIGGTELLQEGKQISDALGLSKLSEDLDRLLKLDKLLEAYEVRSAVNYDLGMKPELGYYTGMIFKGYALGSAEPVLDGGRYDALLHQMNANWAAVGFGVYQDSLLAALKSQNRLATPMHALLMLGQDEAWIPLSAKLREKGILVVAAPEMADDEVIAYAESHGCGYLCRVRDGVCRFCSLDGRLQDEGPLAEAVDRMDQLLSGERRLQV